MSKTRRVSRKPMFIILGLSLTIAIGFSVWNTYFRPTPLTIMAIEPVSLTYGDTTISGTLQKDAPIGEDGTFFLVLPDMRVVMLDVQGIDSLLGLSVSVSGELAPAATSTDPITMTVKTIVISE
jgi:hypothetical protein